MDHDYYQILNIHPNADLPEIKKAYWKKAMECHPDRGGSLEQMKLINLAWEILSNPEAKQRYDQSRSAPDDSSFQQARRADEEHASERAQEYPKQWGDFEKWFKSAVGDFRDAKYGKEDIIPTVQNSISGIIFLLGGAVLGYWFLGIPIYEKTNSFNVGLHFLKVLAILPALGGAWLGVKIHQGIGKLIKTAPSQSSNSNQATSSAATSIISCSKCQQKLRVPVGDQELLVTCKRCHHQFPYQAKQ